MLGPRIVIADGTGHGVVARAGEKAAGRCLAVENAAAAAGRSGPRADGRAGAAVRSGRPARERGADLCGCAAADLPAPAHRDRSGDSGRGAGTAGLSRRLLRAVAGPFRAAGHVRRSAGEPGTAPDRRLAGQWSGDPAGGLAWPSPKVASEPLQATVYTPRPVTASDVLGVVGQYIDRLVPREDAWMTSMGVQSWRTPDGGLQAELWPGRATLIMMHPPAVLGDVRFRSGQLSTMVLLAD